MCGIIYGSMYEELCLKIFFSDERVRTIYNGGEHWEDNDVVNRVEITPDTKIRFLKANIARSVVVMGIERYPA